MVILLLVLEYCEGGEVRWKTEDGHPLLTLDQARRTIRDIVLGLEYRECASFPFSVETVRSSKPDRPLQLTI